MDGEHWPYRATRYYESLIDPADPRDPIARQIRPDPRENLPTPHLSTDPLAEAHHSPVPGLVRRFKDRALVLAHGDCPVHCRHCFRRHRRGGGPLPDGDVTGIVAWLTDHPEVREVLVSGGEPLLLPAAALDTLLERLRGIPSVRWLRLATRMPVVDPARVTKGRAMAAFPLPSGLRAGSQLPGSGCQSDRSAAFRQRKKPC